MADATAGAFIKSYRKYKRLRSSHVHEKSAFDSFITLTISESSRVLSAATLRSTGITPNAEPHVLDYANEMELTCGIGWGKLSGRVSSEAFVDLPLATVGKLQAVFRLYGEEVIIHDRIRGLRSGTVVGWSILHRA
ncbi:hypothetical protein N7475_002070 [Penicillium sp. IBT 31633x]|nr:hypothetical protein N7475_002070 [Penicillium sp. IBT 31633x]